jgi:hypothetical protein
MPRKTRRIRKHGGSINGGSKGSIIGGSKGSIIGGSKGSIIGGLLERNQVLSSIKSIGYEFETDAFIPLFKDKYRSDMGLHYSTVSDMKYSVEQFANVVNRNKMAVPHNDAYDIHAPNGEFYYTLEDVGLAKEIAEDADGNTIDWSYDIGGAVTDIYENFGKAVTVTNERIYIEDARGMRKLVFMHPEDTPANQFHTEHQRLNVLSLSPFRLPDLEMHATYVELANFPRDNIVEATFKDAIKQIYTILKTPVAVDMVRSNLFRNANNEPDGIERPMYTYANPDRYLLSLENTPIETALFSPQFTISVDLANSIPLCNYLLRDNILHNNNAVSPEFTEIMQKNYDMFVRATYLGDDTVRKLFAPAQSQTEPPPPVDDHMKSKLKAIFTHIIYFKLCRNYFVDLPPKFGLEYRTYTKNVRLINLRNNPFLLFSAHLKDSPVLTYLKSVFSADGGPSKLSKMIGIFDMKLEHAKGTSDYAERNLYKFLGETVHNQPKKKVQLYQRVFDIEEDDIMFEFRGFYIALPKFVKAFNKDFKQHGAFSLQTMYEYAMPKAKKSREPITDVRRSRRDRRPNSRYESPRKIRSRSRSRSRSKSISRSRSRDKITDEI